MNKLETDFSIFKKFDFKYSPVGVKFSFKKPAGIKKLNKTLPLCQTIAEAQQSKAPFYYTKENENCVGALVLGMVDMPPFAEAGLIGPKLKIFKEERANMRIYQHIKKFPRDTVNYVAFSKLDQLKFEPDLLLVQATPSQAEIILRSMAYTTGILKESKTTTVIGCSWIFVYPWQSGEVNYIVTGLCFGQKANEVFPEGWILISIPWDWMPIIIQNLKDMDWVLPSYTDGREKHTQRMARALEEGMKESQNP